MVRNKQDRLFIILITKDEAEWFVKCFYNPDSSFFPDFELSLFSPRLETLFKKGFYAHSKNPISAHVASLTIFKELIIQAKLVMGETELYLPEEIFYLKKWISLQKNLSFFESSIKSLFLPVSQQKLQDSPLEEVFLFCKNSNQKRSTKRRRESSLEGSRKKPKL